MQQVESSPRVHRPRSTQFWAFLLIGIGIVWLLGQIGIVTSANLAVLGRIWPLLLIALGIDLLFGRQRGLSVLIGLATLVLIVVLMVVGPSIGLAEGVNLTTDHFTEPLNGATSAQITLNNGIGDMTVQALSDPSGLIDINTTHVGTAHFSTSGTSARTARLDFTDQGGVNFSFLPTFFINPSSNMLTVVGLAARVPTDLHVSGGVGSNTINLSGVNVSGVMIEVGVGDVNVTLPATGSTYSAHISGGVGSSTITVESNAVLQLIISSGVGETRLNLPDNAPVRLAVSSGLGGISSVPAWLSQQSSGGSGSTIYQSAAYAGVSADARIDVTISGGVGSIHVE